MDSWHTLRAQCRRLSLCCSCKYIYHVLELGAWDPTFVSGIYRLHLLHLSHLEACDNSAYTITSTYHDGTLKFYTGHPTQGSKEEDSVEYHMTQLNTFAITGTVERFREGVMAFRNARDWAKGQRDTIIANAYSSVIGSAQDTSTMESSTQSLSQSSVKHNPLESDTSADELPQGKGTDPRPSKRLKQAVLKRPPIQTYWHLLSTKGVDYFTRPEVHRLVHLVSAAVDILEAVPHTLPSLLL